MRKYLSVACFILLLLFPVGLTASPAYEEATVSVKEYITTLMNERCVQINQRFEAMDSGISLARAELDKNQMLLNDLRVKQFVTNASFEDKINPLEKRLTQLETQLVTWLSVFTTVMLLLNFGFYIVVWKRNGSGRAQAK